MSPSSGSMIDTAGWTRDKSERNWHLQYKMATWLHGATRRNVESLSFGPLLTGILTFKWVKFQFHLILCFFHDPSWSELIRPRLAVRVDPVRLLYLPHHLRTQNYTTIPFWGSWNCNMLQGELEAVLLSTEITVFVSIITGKSRCTKKIMIYFTYLATFWQLNVPQYLVLYYQ